MKKVIKSMGNGFQVTGALQDIEQMKTSKALHTEEKSFINC